MQGRLTNFAIDHYSKDIFAGDDKGVIYHFDCQLVLKRQSTVTSHGVGNHAIVLDDHWVYTRDVAGNLVRWRKKDLAPIDFIVSQHFINSELEDGATPVPSPSNALACVENYLIVCNAYGTMSIFDRSSMSFIRSATMTKGAFAEYINTEFAPVLYISDVRGKIYVGSIYEDNFQNTDVVPGGVIHSIVWDKKFKRFWGTSDVTGGIFFLSKQGKVTGQKKLTNDDVEQIAFDSECQKAYVGCFDHYVHVFNNQEDPEEISNIGPFKFQINHIGILDDQRLVVLLESGEIHIVDTASGKVLHKTGGSNALWDLKIIEDRIYCASEYGNIETFNICSTQTAISFVRTTSLGNLNFGRIRKIVPCGQGDFICASTSGKIIRVSSAGEVKWSVGTSGIVRDVAVNMEKQEVVAANEIGEIIRLNIKDGKIIKRIKNNKPVWCIAYDEDDHIIFGERALYNLDGKEAVMSSKMIFLDRETMQPVHIMKANGNHKRIRVLSGQHQVLVNGNGSVAIQIIDTRTFKTVHKFTDWIINTPENALIYNNRLYVISYGYQLITYDLLTNATLDVQYVTEGYPKGLELYVNKDMIPFLIVGGRNFLMAFRIDTETPELVTTRYLFDTDTPASTINVNEELAEVDNLYLNNVQKRQPLRIFEQTVNTSLVN